MVGGAFVRQEVCVRASPSAISLSADPLWILTPVLVRGLQAAGNVGAACGAATPLGCFCIWVAGGGGRKWEEPTRHRGGSDGTEPLWTLSWRLLNGGAVVFSRLFRPQVLWQRRMGGPSGGFCLVWLAH